MERAYILCSTNELLQKELEYLVKVFYETNNSIRNQTNPKTSSG